MPQALLPEGKERSSKEQNEMGQAEYRLMNFKIDPDVKDQFQSLCRSRRSNMTSELNRMIYEFLGNNKQPNTFQRPTNWLSGKGSKTS